jgi:tRNA G18 (ribose-2'-O)-methylase SpoU
MTFTQVKRRMRKGMKKVERHEYGEIARHPIWIISWATDPANIGGLVRLSEAFLVERLIVAKVPSRATAVGTDKWQPVTVGLDELDPAINEARRLGFTIVALEQTDEGHFLGEDNYLPLKMCLLLGNEGSGLPKSALTAADEAVEIRQFGLVGSLNVTVSAGIALYEWSRAWS